MAEGDGAIYRNFKEQVMEAEFDLAAAADQIKVALVTAHVPDLVADDNWTAASGDEVSGTGYTAGGEILTGQDVIETGTGAGAHGKFDAGNVTWTGLNIGGTSGAPSHAIMYDFTHANDLLIAYWEVTTATNGGNYALQWHANGIITLT